MAGKQIDIRFTLDEDSDVKTFIQAIGENLTEVQDAVVLKNDGFSRLLPDEATRQKFISADERVQNERDAKFARDNKGVTG